MVTQLLDQDVNELHGPGRQTLEFDDLNRCEKLFHVWNRAARMTTREWARSWLTSFRPLPTLKETHSTGPSTEERVVVPCSTGPDQNPEVDHLQRAPIELREINLKAIFLPTKCFFFL